MISFLIRKMWKNKWMMLCLFIGNILLVGIVSGTPMYSHATMQRILQRDLQASQIDTNAHPATLTLQYNFNNVREAVILSTYNDTKNVHLPALINSIGIPVASQIQELKMEGWHARPAVQREERPATRSVSFIARDGQFGHINLAAGRLPANELVDGYILECLANETTMIQQDLLMDELLEISNVDLPDGRQLQARIVGQFESSEGAGAFWVENPNTSYDTMLVSEELVRNFFVEGYNSTYRIASEWTVMLDYPKMQAANVPGYLAAIERLNENSFPNDQHVWDFEENFSGLIENFTLSSDKLSVTLWVLQVPIYILLAFYIYMVSRQILTQEQNDISVLKSRGASRRQLFMLYTMQSIFISVISFAIGLYLGVTLCRVLGASSGFLNMVQRAALDVRITADALLFGGAAIFLSVLTMLLPVIRFSRVTIVDYKRSKSGKPKKALWQRFFLDFLCFGVSVYGLYSFNNNREMMAQNVSDVNSVDPLLYISSSLFIIGMGLLCLRLFPYLIKLVFWVGKRFWPPSIYASLLKVIRSAGEEQFIMIFLVFTLAIGIFDAKAARTVNLNNDHMIQYTAGADLIFQEVWMNNQAPGMRPPDGAGGDSQVVWYEPDFERFTDFPEVDSVAKVMETTVEVSKSGQLVENVTLQGIETDTFGKTLWFRDDLLPVHINYYLNTLAAGSNGVLLSDNFRTKLDYKVGDAIMFRDEDENDALVVVKGFIEHWPGYKPVERVILRSGEEVEQDNYLIAANLGYLQTTWGVMPYQVWMKTNTPNNNFFAEFYRADGLRISEYEDAKANLTESRSDPILQGTNGVLTVGFIVTLLVCFTGFLIFWILSIKSRVLQFGIFRAMGMTMRNIISLLINEQLFITFTAIGIGALVGEVSSRLFVPLIQISFSASEQTIPLLIVTEARDYTNLFGIIGGMIVLCLLVLGIFISRIKIAQALKLGED